MLLFSCNRYHFVPPWGRTVSLSRFRLPEVNEVYPPQNEIPWGRTLSPLRLWFPEAGCVFISECGSLRAWEQDCVFLSEWGSWWSWREGCRAQLLKEWHSCWGYNINLLEPIMAEDLTSSKPWASFYARCNIVTIRWHTHRCHTVPRLTTKGQKVGGGPIPENLHPFSKVAEIILFVTLWVYAAHKN